MKEQKNRTEADKDAFMCDKIRGILDFGVLRMKDKPAIGVSDMSRINKEAIARIKEVLELVEWLDDKPTDEPGPGGKALDLSEERIVGADDLFATVSLQVNRTVLKQFRVWDNFLVGGDPEILRYIATVGLWEPDNVKAYQHYIREAPVCPIKDMVREYMRKLTLPEFLCNALDLALSNMRQFDAGGVPF